MDNDEDLPTGEIGLPKMDYELVTSNRDSARTFVHYLVDAACRMAPEREWSSHDLVEVIRFANAGGPLPVDFLDGRVFNDRLGEAIERADRYGENFSVMVVNMTGPEENNLLYGSILDGLTERLRRSDKVFLFHGRAAILLPYTSGKDLTALKDRIEELVTAVLGPEATIRIEHAAYPSRLGTREAMLHWAGEHVGS